MEAAFTVSAASYGCVADIQLPLSYLPIANKASGKPLDSFVCGLFKD